MSYVHIFGSRLVGESRVGRHRYNLDVLSNAHGQNLAEKFGLRGTNIDENSSGLPILYLNNYTNLGGDDFKPLYFKETFWQINQSFTYSAGGHTLKTGAEVRAQGGSLFRAVPGRRVLFGMCRTEPAAALAATRRRSRALCSATGRSPAFSSRVRGCRAP